MKYYKILIILLIYNIIIMINGANILFFMGLSSYSHRITIWPLVERLANDGHQITFLQDYISTTKNHSSSNTKIIEFYTKEWEIFIKNNKKLTNSKYDFIEQRYLFGKADYYTFVTIMSDIGLNMCHELLKYNSTKDWINKSKFDLIFIDSLFNDCGLGLGYKFQSKIILFTTLPLFSWYFDPFGIPNESSWISDVVLGFKYPMTFLDRIMNTIMVPINYYYRQWFYFPSLEKILKKHLNITNMPTIQELERNISLIFTNTHYSEEVARSFPPFVIPIGGIHCEDYINNANINNIDKSMGEFLSASQDKGGFIYISFGSVAEISSSPKEVQYIFFNALKNIKMQFLWKWEGERPIDMPNNVFTAEWIPQQSILAHPQIKGFITHGGLMSIQEALLFEVPLIVIPLFADQDYNAYRVENTGRGIQLALQSLKSYDLQNAILEIVMNKTYKNNMKKASNIFKDRPQRSIDTAAWWTEFVLRHDDVSFLKPLSRHQSLIERRLIDVWLFIIFVIIILTSSILIVCIIIMNKILAIFYVSSHTHSNNPRTKHEIRVKNRKKVKHILKVE